MPVFLRKPITTCDFPGGGGSDPRSTSSDSKYERV